MAHRSTSSASWLEATNPALIVTTNVLGISSKWYLLIVQATRCSVFLNEAGSQGPTGDRLGLVQIFLGRPLVRIDLSKEGIQVPGVYFAAKCVTR